MNKDQPLLVRHELRTLLTAAQGYIELANVPLLKERLPDGSLPQEAVGRLQTYVAYALEEHEHLLHLLDDLDTKEGIFSITAEQLDLAALVRNVVQRRAVLLPTGRLQGQIQGEAIIVHADPRRIEQVLSNYIENALAYSPDATAVIVIVSCMDRYVRVQVVDQGIGISRWAQWCIWRRGYRTAEAQRLRGTRSGLGLFLVRELITRQGGRTGVESHPNHGSTFWLDWDVREALADPPVDLIFTWER